MHVLQFSDRHMQVLHDALFSAPLSWGAVNPVLASIQAQIQQVAQEAEKSEPVSPQPDPQDADILVRSPCGGGQGRTPGA